MKVKNNILLFLFLLLPILIAFRALFLPGPLVWGDAPYFYPERLNELLAPPFAWSSWEESFGGVSKILWIYPLMLGYGFLNWLLGFNNDVLIRVFFYFPSVFLSFLSPFIFARYLGFGRLVAFFSSFIYVLNTYFLILIDGGQVGIALAYGIFPLILLSLRKLIDRITVSNFLLATITMYFSAMADIRIAAIAIFSILSWLIMERVFEQKLSVGRNLLTIFFVFLCTLGLGVYWILPVVTLSAGQDYSPVSGNNFVSLLHALFIFQPHWPLNEFGNTSPPLFYFVGIPLLAFGGLFLKTVSGGQKQVLILSLLTLIFAFLAKGESPPLGEFYQWLTTNIPFTNAFRDSTKFFIPLALFMAVLVGVTTERLIYFFRRNPLVKKIIPVLVYGYILFLVHPALIGRLNGVLAVKNITTADVIAISSFISKKEDSFRTIWFPERNPFAFHTEGKPTVSAKDLVNLRPFASINTGTFDRFNFINNRLFYDWFNIFGIRYLVFSGNYRKVTYTKEEQKEWNSLLKLVNSTELKKLDLRTGIPVYENPIYKPRVYTTDKAYVVLGSENIYQKIKSRNPEFSIASQPFLFLEDGKFDPWELLNFDPESFILIFNNKNETDLSLSLLQNFFLSEENIANSQWIVRKSQDYLQWKYEFLVNGVETKEFDYGKGIVFSTEEKEMIKFKFSVSKEGEYVIAVRSLAKDLKEPLSIKIEQEYKTISYETPGRFEWFLQEPITLPYGDHELTFINKKGIHAVNIVAVIPAEKLEQAKTAASQILRDFETIQMDTEDFRNLSTANWETVFYEQNSPVNYKVILPRSSRWVVFTDKYHPGWQLLQNGNVSRSYPFYSAINGFYIMTPGKAEINFAGQKEVKLGIYFSLGAALLLAGFYTLAVYKTRK